MHLFGDQGDDPHTLGTFDAQWLLVPPKEVGMAGVTARMASANLTRSASAGSDTVHGVAGLAVGDHSCVVVEDTGVLEKRRSPLMPTALPS